MVDTLGLTVYHSMVNYSMDFMAEVGAKINIDIKKSNEYRIIGMYKNMQVYIEPTFIHIEGSLPKFYYGSNLITLSREEPGIIIDKLAVELGLPLREAIVTRVDIAANIEMDNLPKSYFPYLSMLKKFDRSMHKETLYYRMGWCELYFYNKILEAKKGNDSLLTPELLAKNILRYEMRFYHAWLNYYIKPNIKAIELYGDRSDVCCELISIWYYKYENIIKRGGVDYDFELSLEGIKDWCFNDTAKRMDLVKLIESKYPKGNAKVGRLRRIILDLLKSNENTTDKSIQELNRKMIECTEVY